MSNLDDRTWSKQCDEYPQVYECIGKSKTLVDALPSYEFLNNLRKDIPKELYAYYLRKLLRMSTANVPKDLRLEMLCGVEWKDIMYQDELEEINSWDEYITVYRGTEPAEDIPGISWSIYRYIAESSEFNHGRVFKASIPKQQILLYLAHEDREGEIIADIREGYEILQGDI